jgi:hypothetical protein
MLRRVALVRTDVRRVFRLLVTTSSVPSSAILVTLMMEAMLSSETSVPPRTTRRNVPEEGILHLNKRSCNILPGTLLYNLT